MAYTLGTAAKATGRNKTTILRAIKDGKISAVRDAASGAWLIEPAELHRIYPAAADATPDATERNPEAMAELRARLADKNALIAAHRSEIDDLRLQRDHAHQQLAMALGQIAALLTDQRAAPPATPTRRWWRWGR